jgi:hypothetical protein
MHPWLKRRNKRNAINVSHLPEHIHVKHPFPSIQNQNVQSPLTSKICKDQSTELGKGSTFTIKLTIKLVTNAYLHGFF